MTNRKRITISSQIHAKRVYPKMESAKFSSAKIIDLLLTDDEALNLAQHLISASRQAKELTIAAVRKPSARTNQHLITVSYEPRMKK